MKKLYLFSLVLGAALTGLTSCMEIDNFDEPEAKIHGKLIDSTTGELYQTDQDDVHVRIWEMSYSTNPSPQDLSVKMDGTYNREHLFAGTYDMVPFDGSWWPCDTVRNVKIGNGGVSQDFTVTPYLKIKDFNAELEQDESGDYFLRLSGRLFAPITEGLPQVREIRPFLSDNHFCGAANHIDYYYQDAYRVNLRKMWTALGDMETGEGFETYSIVVPVKKGWHYWVRLGANVNDERQKFNYSEVKEILVPNT
ncbi:MAG: DUF3823 domain-containing protein [Prevotella sp.]|nr:DUF3823 domain-containing protein [Prevotella sp.]